MLQELKADPELAQIPVLMLSILDEKNKGYALGASEYMTKPFDRNRLRKLLGQVRQRGGGRWIAGGRGRPEHPSLAGARPLKPKAGR